jgi:hypothetical protein
MKENNAAEVNSPTPILPINLRFNMYFPLLMNVVKKDEKGKNKFIIYYIPFPAPSIYHRLPFK